MGSAFELSPAVVDRLPEIKPLFRITHVRILVVVDTEVQFDSGDTSFGVGHVIADLRATTLGCMRFAVDIAVRDGGAFAEVVNPGAEEARYTGFRFDSMIAGAPVIERYHQVWCFGFKPDNSGGGDERIDRPEAIPASDSELAVLAAWMDGPRKGGVFATGDHDYLGASMCRRIPRVGTMRRWTNADGVPPIDSPDRIDTLRRPPGDDAPLGNTPHQGDLTVQPIEWVTWMQVRSGFYHVRARPHPVLCHPELGPIDVMPDHAHEGLCRDTGTVPLDGVYAFDAGRPRPEYPPARSGGARPEPMVIAYGSTLGAPPESFVKGPQPSRPRFPMISVYDGHAADVGRVATDATWHHWMNVNISEMRAANTTDWQKISRYYLNLAVWLCPPGMTTDCMSTLILRANYTWLGRQEFSPKLETTELGRALGSALRREFGPCWVTRFVLDVLVVLNPLAEEQLRIPEPDPCLTCPPFELIEDVVLGGVVRESIAAAAELSRGKLRAPEALFERFVGGAGTALAAFVDRWAEDAARSQKRFEALVPKRR